MKFYSVRVVSGVVVQIVLTDWLEKFLEAQVKGDCFHILLLEIKNFPVHFFLQPLILNEFAAL